MNANEAARIASAKLAQQRGEEDPAVVRAREAIERGRTSREAMRSPPVMVGGSNAETGASLEMLLGEPSQEASENGARGEPVTAALAHETLARSTLLPAEAPGSRHSSDADRPAISLRLAVPSDLAYIADCWVGQTLRLPITAHLGPQPAEALRWRVGRLLRTWGARVACDAGDEGVILGWSVVARKHGHPTRLLFVYVRNEFRGQGIGRQLTMDLRDGEEVVVGAMPRRRGSERESLPTGWRYSGLAHEWCLVEGPGQ